MNTHDTSFRVTLDPCLWPHFPTVIKPKRRLPAVARILDRDPLSTQQLSDVNTHVSDSAKPVLAVSAFPNPLLKTASHQEGAREPAPRWIPCGAVGLVLLFIPPSNNTVLYFHSSPLLDSRSTVAFLVFSVLRLYTQ